MSSASTSPVCADVFCSSVGPPLDSTGAIVAQSVPTTIGTTEAWTFTCTPPGGSAVTRQVTVARGETADLGAACTS